ncbi:hypothetical protein KB879_33520 (plasmid) [Cupriavidus sp. KK10]|jgi:uncharacterized protein YciI|uniref:YciI family protein n=1 Tax=Cupriavidus sp. KK10 TaxID=1478019 RepID=UPI001BA7BAFC|nr:YciI family protein [Cupriavidus sp. KK10]QUN32541.1 hypothetical protein KB879_33520 [Cupriavidus sp. KK10]
MFIVHCLDKAGAAASRKQNRALHVAYIKTTQSVVKAAGPLLSAEGEPVGGIFMLDVHHFADALEWADGDPFRKIGIYEKVEVHQWNLVMSAGIPAQSATVPSH